MCKTYIHTPIYKSHAAFRGCPLLKNPKRQVPGFGTPPGSYPQVINRVKK
jgi:hypothetical protein